MCFFPTNSCKKLEFTPIDIGNFRQYNTIRHQACVNSIL